MDREQKDLPSLGAFGIFKESFELIFTWRKLFMKIVLALILPLSFISVVYYGISTFFLSKIIEKADPSTLNHSKVTSLLTYTHISESISSEWTVYWLLINAAYLVVSLILSISSISVISYTVACIYTDKEPSFKRVIRVIPKVWKRLVITYLCNNVIIFVYTFVIVFVTYLLVIGITIASNKSKEGQVGVSILVLIYAILFIMGFLYLGIIWQLANVVSILEKKKGMQAISKSKTLMKKGKMGASIGVFFMLGLGASLNYFLIKELGALDWKSICFGILSLVWMTFGYLLTIIVQTVFYFVCKFYHQEIVDKSSLVDHLEALLGEFYPLDVKNSKQEPLLNV